MTQPKAETDDLRKMRILWGAHLFVHNNTRKASTIANTTGLTVPEVFELAGLPIWKKALAYFGYTGDANIKNLAQYRKRKETLPRAGDLNKAERLWGDLVNADAHINPPADFSAIFQQVFWRSE